VKFSTCIAEISQRPDDRASDFIYTYQSRQLTTQLEAPPFEIAESSQPENSGVELPKKEHRIIAKPVATIKELASSTSSSQSSQRFKKMGSTNSSIIERPL